MAKLVYLLCAFTSIGCTALLFRGYWRTRLPLLFWSSAAFLAFALANILLFVDLIVLPECDLLPARLLANLLGVVLLLYGLIRTNS